MLSFYNAYRNKQIDADKANEYLRVAKDNLNKQYPLSHMEKFDNGGVNYFFSHAEFKWIGKDELTFKVFGYKTKKDGEPHANSVSVGYFSVEL